jgi:Ni,Fe-hydrogenase I cytochrome b subunit
MAQSQQTPIERAWHRLEFWGLLALLVVGGVYMVFHIIDPVAAERTAYGLARFVKDMIGMVAV